MEVEMPATPGMLAPRISINYDRPASVGARRSMQQMPVGAGIPVAACSYIKSRKAIRIRKVSNDMATSKRGEISGTLKSMIARQKHKYKPGH
jgi:hypothetical protein